MLMVDCKMFRRQSRTAVSAAMTAGSITVINITGDTFLLESFDQEDFQEEFMSIHKCVISSSLNCPMLSLSLALIVCIYTGWPRKLAHHFVRLIYGLNFTKY